jgi:2-methylisocitrate lyase-like PEP mutase family enzyme
LTPLKERVTYPPMPDSRTSELRGKAELLGRLHVEGPMLVLPNAWDAGSARIFVETGFKALATTSAGIAFSLGFPDGERISRDEMLAAVGRITRRISVPITADMEAGYGEAPREVAETVRRVIDAGVVGMNLEDRMDGKQLIDFPLAVERVGAARAAAHAAGVPLVLNARTDAFEVPELRPEQRLAEAVRRGNAFRDVGADSVFVPFVNDRGTIEQLVQQIRAPVNILGTPNAPSLKDMAALGVRRITFGSAPMRATLGLVRRMAREWKEKGTYGTLEAYGIPFAELQRLFA